MTLAFSDWPQGDRDAWDRLFVDGGLFDPVGRGCGWAPETVKKFRNGHSRWLRFIETHHPGAFHMLPHGRLTQELIGNWVGQLESDGLKPNTIASFIDGLVQLHAAFDKGQTPQWLSRYKRTLMADAYNRSDRPDYRITIDHIWHQTLTVLKALEPSADLTIRSAITYRDRLMLALLAFTLLRRKNLSHIDLEKDLKKVDDGWVLMVDGRQVKNRREIRWWLPPKLCRHLDVYLAKVRQKLMRGKQSDSLWINNVGTTLLPDDVAKAIKRTTRRLFGITLTPHDLRRIAPTTIASDAPEQIYLASQILGHSSRAITEKHYNRASSLSAGRRHTVVIEAARRKGAKMVEDEPHNRR